MPMSGRTIRPESSGSGSSARIPALVAHSVAMTLRAMPTRDASTPQTNLPVAPPAKTRARARPIVGKIVDAERRPEARSLGRAGGQRGAERMLHAGARAAEGEAHDQAEKAAAPADEEITDRRRRGAGGEDATLAEPLGGEAGRNLQ